jgi:hypothetical protein
MMSVELKAVGNRLQPGPRRRLFHVGHPVETGWSPYCVTPGGRFLLNLSPDDSRGRNVLVQNWTALVDGRK